MVNCGVVVGRCIGGEVRRLYGVCGGGLMLVMYGIVVSCSSNGLEWCYCVMVCVLRCANNTLHKKHYPLKAKKRIAQNLLATKSEFHKKLFSQKYWTQKALW